MATGGNCIVRLAAWLGDRLPRVDAESERVDWFLVGLVAGPCCLGAVAIGVRLANFFGQPSSVPPLVLPQRTLTGYAAAHAFADRELEIIGLVAIAYPAVLWVVVKIATRRRRAP